jgi:hypothetical protein
MHVLGTPAASAKDSWTKFWAIIQPLWRGPIRSSYLFVEEPK